MYGRQTFVPIVSIPSLAQHGSKDRVTQDSESFVSIGKGSFAALCHSRAGDVQGFPAQIAVVELIGCDVFALLEFILLQFVIHDVRREMLRSSTTVRAREVEVLCMGW